MRIRQRIQKSNKILLFPFRELQGANQRAFARMIGAAAVVMIDDRSERGHAAIVHIRRGEARVAQARDLEFGQIRGVMREPHAADIGVLRVEAIVFKGIVGEVEAAMAAGTIGLLTEKQFHSPNFRI